MVGDYSACTSFTRLLVSVPPPQGQCPRNPDSRARVHRQRCHAGSVRPPVLLRPRRTQLAARAADERLDVLGDDPEPNFTCLVPGLSSAYFVAMNRSGAVPCSTHTDAAVIVVFPSKVMFVRAAQAVALWPGAGFSPCAGGLAARRASAATTMAATPIKAITR